jgi:hypothetical protein
MREALAGQHSGVVVNAFLNRVPVFLNQRRVFGISTRVASGRWSSVMMIKTFGWRAELATVSAAAIEQAVMTSKTNASAARSNLNLEIKGNALPAWMVSTRSEGLRCFAEIFPQ